MKDTGADEISLGFIRSHALFAGIEDESLIDVLSHMRQEDVPAANIVIREGENGDCLYLIVEGSVEVLKEVPDSQGHPMERIATLNKGETFGEMAIVDHLERSATVKTLEDAVLLKLSEEGLSNIRANLDSAYNSILKNLANEVSRRLRMLDTRYAITLFSSKNP